MRSLAKGIVVASSLALLGAGCAGYQSKLQGRSVSPPADEFTQETRIMDQLLAGVDPDDFAPEILAEMEKEEEVDAALDDADATAAGVDASDFEESKLEGVEE